MIHLSLNQALANLRHADEDRALLLAGVSHDLRTPLARLRLGIEVGGRDVAERGQRGRFGRVAVRAAQAEWEGHVLEGRELGHQGRRLEHHADLTASGCQVLGEPRPGNRALGWG